MADRAPLPHDFMPTLPEIAVTSTDIADGQPLPSVHEAGPAVGRTGGNRSPQLSWSGFPARTEGFAVTCFDPDAPTGSGFWHWVLFDIPVDVTSLPTGAAGGDQAGLPAGAMHARNDAGGLEYIGAFPPPGEGPHRYVFTVYAVDAEHLGVDATASPAVVGFNLRYHAIARGSLIAPFTYEG